MKRHGIVSVAHGTRVEAHAPRIDHGELSNYIRFNDA